MTKPGPKTDAGKAVVRLNPVRHGALSVMPVIPGLEREEDWDAHLAGMMASLASAGHLETELAERAALMLWRLKRVARFERDVVVAAQEGLEGELADRRRLRPGKPESVEAAREKLCAARERLDLLERLPTMNDDAPLEAEGVGSPKRKRPQWGASVTC